MWFPSLSSVSLGAASLHIALASRIEARDDEPKLNTENPFRNPTGGSLDTAWPILLKWDPTTKGTVSIRLLKGKVPEGMAEVEVIADHIHNIGAYMWLTGDWLEDSKTMAKGWQYGLRIIDDETEDYNYSPPFDLIVPHSTFKAGDKDQGSAKKGSTTTTTTDNDSDETDFVEPDGTVQKDQSPYSQHGKPTARPEAKGNSKKPTEDAGIDEPYEENDENPTVGVGKNHKFHGKPEAHKKPSSGTNDPYEKDFEEPVGPPQEDQEPPPHRHTKGHHKKPTTEAHYDDDDFEEPSGPSQEEPPNKHHQHKPPSKPETKGSHKRPTVGADPDESDFEEPSGPSQEEPPNKHHQHKPPSKPETKGSHKKPTVNADPEDDADFEEPEGTVQTKGDTKGGKVPFDEPYNPITSSSNNRVTKPNTKFNPPNTNTDGTVMVEEESAQSSKGGLSKAAKIGIAVGVVMFFVLVGLGVALWMLRARKKSRKEKQRSMVGYDGVGSFIAEGKQNKLYDGPQMTQYNPRHSVEGRYDPPTGQGLPVVGSTPRHSMDTRYDPPGQAQQAHH